MYILKKVNGKMRNNHNILLTKSAMRVKNFAFMLEKCDGNT